MRGPRLGSESELHLRLKEAADEELRRLGYEVAVEPTAPPRRDLSWTGYRPDLFAERVEQDRTCLAVVECETNPSRRRLEGKRSRDVMLQTRLFQAYSFSFVLVVPERRASTVLDPSVRGCWDIWLVDPSRRGVAKITRSRKSRGA